MRNCCLCLLAVVFDRFRVLLCECRLSALLLLVPGEQVSVAVCYLFVVSDLTTL